MSILDAELWLTTCRLFTGLYVDESKYAIQFTKVYCIMLFVTSAVTEVKLTDSKQFYSI